MTRLNALSARIAPRQQRLLPLEKKLAQPKVTQQPAPNRFPDEMSPAKTKPIRDMLVGHGFSTSHSLHNIGVALRVKSVSAKLFAKESAPLSAAQSPRPGPNGRYVAPNGDPLIRVKLNDGKGIVGQSEYVLINPKTNEVYKESNSGGFVNHKNYFGPEKLPAGSRFQGKSFTEAELKMFERIANGGLFGPPVKGPSLLEKLEQQLSRGDVKFGGNAPDPKNVASQTVLKNEHPFTYYVITLKNDPDHVIIKRVLTGGFAPSLPGSGDYSEPVSTK